MLLMVLMIRTPVVTTLFFFTADSCDNRTDVMNNIKPTCVLSLSLSLMCECLLAGGGREFVRKRLRDLSVGL